MSVQRFAVLKAGTAYRETRERQGDFDRMFLDLLAEPDQAWDVFDVEHGQFPTDAALYDGFVITGSPASAYDELPWIRALLDVVQAGYGRGQTLLGICFGHQILAQALGGNVRPNSRGWDIGVRELKLTPEAAEVPELAACSPPLRILELHQDAVMRLPPQAVTLASSDHTACEIFRIGDRTLGIQGHPEFEVDVIRVALLKLRSAGVIDATHQKLATESLDAVPHYAFFKTWLRGFLRNRRLIHAA